MVLGRSRYQPRHVVAVLPRQASKIGPAESLKVPGTPTSRRVYLGVGTRSAVAVAKTPEASSLVGPCAIAQRLPSVRFDKSSKSHHKRSATVP